jgi:hypothetical protein
MKTARFEYRCRRCGVVGDNSGASEPMAQKYLTEATMGDKATTMINLNEIHLCEDGGRGVTDLLGYRLDD